MNERATSATVSSAGVGPDAGAAAVGASAGTGAVAPSERGIAVAGWGDRPGLGVYAALLLTSAALLTLEISLTRFFSYTIWYHFAYLTISVALLGFGASGSIVAAFPRLFAEKGRRFLVGSLVAASLLTVAGLSFLAQFPLEIENMLKRPLGFSFSLLAYYVIVGAPFLLAGFSVSVPFAAWPHRMGRLYFWDLVGAAIGCALVGLLIEVLGVPGLIFFAAGMMMLAAAALAWDGGRQIGALVMGSLAIAWMTASGPAGHRLPILVTSSKHLHQLQSFAATDKPFDQRTDRFSKWTAINRVDAFGWQYPSPLAFWTNNGAGHSWQWGEHRPQVARLTYDGSNGSDVYGGDVVRDFEFLDHHLLGTPYEILERPNVLVIGVGGGIDLYNAIHHGARHVTGVELQKETVGLLQGKLRDFTNDFFVRDDVTLVASEGRHFARKSKDTYDLLQITTVDTFSAQSVGAYVLAESYLYTVEALEDYFRILDEDGLVSLVMGDLVYADHAPPLATRLALIGYRALERRGISDPENHIVVIGSITKGIYAQDEIVLIRKTPFTPEDLSRLSGYATANGFNVLYAPGDRTSQIAGILAVDEPAREKAIEEEMFDVDATWDNDPFFYNVAKWRNFVAADEGTPFFMPGSYMGQLVLVLMVAQSTLLGAVLIFAPLVLGARGGLAGHNVASFLAYFLALGVGFMFVEISFVQSFVLFLGSPTYALSVTIFSLLLFSGIGSLVSTRFAAAPEKTLGRLAPVLAALVVVYAFGLARVFEAALHLELGTRIAIAVFAQMPLGLLLGMFMPLGVATIARVQPRLVPWAWGVNGVGSVAGTTLAVLLAMAAGFRAVSITAAVIYLVGTFLLLRARRA